MDSALYQGKVFHTRHLPKKHHFGYEIFLFWLALDELPQVQNEIRGFSFSKWSWLQFRRSDYLGDPDVPLEQAVLEKMSNLAGKRLSGRVFLLGQVRMLGLYFSPVNFYYLMDDDGTFSHVLAEVSNTPWNERHHYLVDLNVQENSEKSFHVSPFNPMNMDYQWKIFQPAEQLALHLSCVKQSKHFDASLHLHRKKLNSRTLLRVLMSIPNMTVKTVWGIYWQALKLFIKGVPVYPHPASKK